MSAQNASNRFGSPLKGSGNDSTRTVGPIHRSTWEVLPDALQRVLDANNTSDEEAKAAVCQAISDGTITIRGRLGTHTTRPMSSKAVLDGSAFEIPTALEPRHFDWDQSRPTKTWVVKRGVYDLPGHWHLDLIELYKPDVTRILCTPQLNGRIEDASEEWSTTTALRSAKRIPARPRGPRAKKLQATIEAMENDICQEALTRADLEGMYEKNLSARYDVSRDTARKARKIVLLEFVEL